MSIFALVERMITAEELAELRAAVNWWIPNRAALQKGLDNSLYGVCAVAGDRVVGCTRVVGDSSTVFYIQDVIVHPEFQGKGVGREMMKAAMEYIRNNACEGAFVGLMAAKGKEGFYEQFDFFARPNDKFGCGMMQFWKP